MCDKQKCERTCSKDMAFPMQALLVSRDALFSSPLLALCMPISVSLHYLNRRGTTTAPKYCANRRKEVPGGTVYQPRQIPFFHTETSRGSPSPFHTISYPNFSPDATRSGHAILGGFYANVWSKNCSYVTIPLSQKYTLQTEHINLTKIENSSRHGPDKLRGTTCKGNKKWLSVNRIKRNLSNAKFFSHWGSIIFL